MAEVPAVEGALCSSDRPDRAVFVRLVDEHHAVLQRVAYLICRDLEQSRDAVQATWEVAWRRLPDGDASAQRAWLIAVAANAAKRQLRRNRLRSVLEMRTARQHPPDHDHAAVLDLDYALRRLSTRDRQILGLRYGVGLTSDEIAPLVGLSGSGVRGPCRPPP